MSSSQSEKLQHSLVVMRILCDRLRQLILKTGTEEQQIAMLACLYAARAEQNEGDLDPEARFLLRSEVEEEMGEAQAKVPVEMTLPLGVKVYKQ